MSVDIDNFVTNAVRTVEMIVTDISSISVFLVCFSELGAQIKYWCRCSI